MRRSTVSRILTFSEEGAAALIVVVCVAAGGVLAGASRVIERNFSMRVAESNAVDGVLVCGTASTVSGGEFLLA